MVARGESPSHTFTFRTCPKEGFSHSDSELFPRIQPQTGIDEGLYGQFQIGVDDLLLLLLPPTMMFSMTIRPLVIGYEVYLVVPLLRVRR